MFNPSLQLDAAELKGWYETNIARGPVQWRGEEATTNCQLPSHGSEDRNPSFSFSAEKGAWFCHKENTGGGVLELAKRLNIDPPLSLTPRAKSPIQKAKKRILATYDYRNEKGDLVYQVVRYEPKDFRQRQPDGAGGWIWKMQGIEPIPYRLPELLQALEKNQLVCIVEGEKDVDNLLAAGLTATCNHGGAGKWLDSHSKYFPKSAEVVILQDNDQAGKDHALKVAQSLFGAGLENIKIVDLPDLKNKGDVSDWLALGHTKDELLGIIEKVDCFKPQATHKHTLCEELKNYKDLLAKKTSKYSINNAGFLCYEKMTSEGPLDIQLANFVAMPVREIVRDNGQDTNFYFEIEGVLATGRPLPRVTIGAKEFSQTNWIPEKWGLQANIEPGSAAKDKVRHVIQVFAGDIQRDTIYVHLGWRRINGRWVYLHSTGAVGMDGVSVEVEGGLERYTLPEEPGGIESIKHILKLLEVAPLEVTIPLFASVFLAPLCEPLRHAGLEPAFVLWVAGITGAMKSTLASLYLSCFGDFNGKTLPASFKDTGNAIEKKSFLCKDTLIVVDDYHPTASKNEAQKMESIAQQILRGYGDRVGRGRMNSDTKLRATYTPRGLAWVTGEDHPDAGQSTSARYLTVELKRGDIDLDILNDLQSNTIHLRKAMRSYIEFLAPQMDMLPEQFKVAFPLLRERALSAKGTHRRLPEVVAWLYLGLAAGLEYAATIGAVEERFREEWLARGWKVLIELAEKQGRRIEQDRPAIKFLNALSELIAGGSVYLNELAAAQDEGTEQKNSMFVGWRDESWFYLLPDTVFKAVVQFFNGQGVRFPVTSRTLWKNLDVENVILTENTAGENRRLIQKTIGGKKYRILQLQRSAIQI